VECVFCFLSLLIAITCTLCYFSCVFSYRLGETDKALYHYKQAGAEANPNEIAKVKILQVYLNKCSKTLKLGDWNTLITETNITLSSGADSAPQVSCYFFYIIM